MKLTLTAPPLTRVGLVVAVGGLLVWSAINAVEQAALSPVVIEECPTAPYAGGLELANARSAP